MPYSSQECLFASADENLSSIAGGVFDAFHRFHQVYADAHPYAAVSICVVGTLLNVCNIIVLSRPTMLNPINALLCAIAVCDVWVMLSTLAFVAHYQLLPLFRCNPDDFSIGWARFMLGHAHGTVIGHSTSLWLTVLLAFVRTLSVRRATRTQSNDCITVKGSIAVGFVTLFSVAAVNVPNMLTFVIDVQLVPSGVICDSTDVLAQDQSNASATGSGNQTEYLQEWSTDTFAMVRAMAADCRLLQAAFWTNGICFKLIPCALLTVSIGMLLRLLAEVGRRRRSLAQMMNKRSPARDRTTPMLLAVLSIFLITELPQGALHVANGLLKSQSFYQYIYLSLGDFMDLLSLVNSSINFVIYCTMSEKFRKVFWATILPRKASTLLHEAIDRMELSVYPRQATTVAQSATSNARLSTVPEQGREVDALLSVPVSVSVSLVRQSPNLSKSSSEDDISFDLQSGINVCP